MKLPHTPGKSSCPAVFDKNIMAPAYSDVNNVRNLSSQVHIQSELQLSQNLIDELVNGFVPGL